MIDTPYAEVIGDPIGHSKSPLIHGFWLERLGIEGSYRATQVQTDDLATYFRSRRSDPDWRGCNVTVPHKEAVSRFIDTLTPLAQEVGAVNTIVRRGDTLVGDNTDVLGIIDALPSALFPNGVPDSACLIGSGGAALGAISAFRRMKVRRIAMNVRNPGKGEALLSRLGDRDPAKGRIGTIDDSANLTSADLIVNATVLGMTGKEPMPETLLHHLEEAKPDAVVLDMVYHPLETDLLKAARSAGLTTVDGLEMLVGQAAAAFEHFFGTPPPRQDDPALRARLTS